MERAGLLSRKLHQPYRKQGLFAPIGAKSSCSTARSLRRELASVMRSFGAILIDSSPVRHQAKNTEILAQTETKFESCDEAHCFLLDFQNDCESSRPRRPCAVTLRGTRTPPWQKESRQALPRSSEVETRSEGLGTTDNGTRLPDLPGCHQMAALAAPDP